MGRKQWEMTVAQAPRKALKRMDAQSSVGLPANVGFEEVTIYSAPGTIAVVANMYFIAPAVAAATSGKHRIHVRYINSIGNLILGESNYNKAVEFNFSVLQSADVQQIPIDLAAQTILSQNIRFDDVIGLTFWCYNETNALQTGTRLFSIMAVQEQVTK